MSADTKQTQSPSKYDRLIAAARAVPPVPTIVVHPCDETSLRGTVDSAGAGIIRPVLVGPEADLIGDVTAPTMAIGAGAVLEGNYRVGKNKMKPEVIDAPEEQPTEMPSEPIDPEA